MTSERSPIAIEAYTAVDHGRDPAALIATMDAVEALPGFQEARELALRGLTLRPGQRVLDVGCGSGGALPAVLERISPGGQAVGVDLSETMIAEARRRWASPDRPLRFEIADARALPFETGSFDACRTDRMMSHVPQPEAALAEMLRVTRPGGRIAVIDVDIEGTIVDAPVLEQGSTDGQLDTARVRRWWAALAEQDALGNLFALLPVIVVAGRVP